MIEASGIVKRFGVRRVLDGAGIAVARGEVAVIVGASGSGKSTFLRCLNGLEDFESGAVAVGDLRLDPRLEPARRADLLRKIRLRMGMVFQSFNLFPHWSLLKNVTAAPILVLGLSRAAAEDRAKKLLDRVGMGDRLDAAPSSLSGGQQQRVAIARALAMAPEAILFDEPTSALDPRMTAEVLAVMADLASDGQTMIVVTHAISFAKRAAHSLHVFDGGRIVESGPPERILGDPQSEPARRLLCEVMA